MTNKDTLVAQDKKFAQRQRKSVRTHLINGNRRTRASVDFLLRSMRARLSSPEERSTCLNFLRSCLHLGGGGSGCSCSIMSGRSWRREWVALVQSISIFYSVFITVSRGSRLVNSQELLVTKVSTVGPIMIAVWHTSPLYVNQTATILFLHLHLRNFLIYCLWPLSVEEMCLCHQRVSYQVNTSTPMLFQARLSSRHGPGLATM